MAPSMSPASNERFDSNRQRSDSLAGGVIDVVGDRACRPDAGHPADHLRADVADHQIGSIEQLDLQRPYVRIHGNLVFGDIVVQEATEARIDLARFAQSRADSPDEAAQQLPLRRAAAEHAAAIGDGYHPRYSSPRHE